MSCGISSPKQLFRVVTNAEGTLAPYRAPDPRGGRAPFRNTFIPPSHQTGGGRALPSSTAMVRAQPGLEGIPPPLPFRRTRVILASAHLNHDPGDNRQRNLAALCQAYHMRHDAGED